MNFKSYFRSIFGWKMVWEWLAIFFSREPFTDRQSFPSYLKIIFSAFYSIFIDNNNHGLAIQVKTQNVFMNYEWPKKSRMMLVMLLLLLLLLLLLWWMSCLGRMLLWRSGQHDVLISNGTRVRISGSVFVLRHTITRSCVRIPAHFVLDSPLWA